MSNRVIAPTRERPQKPQKHCFAQILPHLLQPVQEHPKSEAGSFCSTAFHGFFLQECVHPFLKTHGLRSEADERAGPQLAWTGIIPLSPPQIHSSAGGGELGQCVRQREFALSVLKKELCDNATFGMYLAKLFRTVLFLCISKVIHKVVQLIKKNNDHHFYFIF